MQCALQFTCKYFSTPEAEYVKRSEAGNFNVPYWGKWDFKSKRIRLHDTWYQKMTSYMEDEKKGQRIEVRYVIAGHQ